MKDLLDYADEAEDSEEAVIRFVSNNPLGFLLIYYQTRSQQVVERPLWIVKANK